MSGNSSACNCALAAQFAADTAELPGSRKAELLLRFYLDSPAVVCCAVNGWYRFLVKMKSKGFWCNGTGDAFQT